LRAARIRADLLFQLALERALRGSVQRPRPYLPRRVLAVGGRFSTLEDGLGALHLGRDRPDLVRRVRLVRLEGDLRAALEVDAEIESEDDERDGAGDDGD